jgi:hypothetical protein
MQKIKEFGDKMTALLADAQTSNEPGLREAAGKLFDEFMLHFTNVLAIAKDDKEPIVDENWRKLLLPPDVSALFAGLAMQPRHHHMHGQGQPAPGESTPPAGPDDGE